jgi:hypothetical protein
VSTWKSNVGGDKIDRATRAGLQAAAYVLSNAVKERLRGGYLSGKFVTGQVINSVTIADPTKAAEGWHIRVGTNLDYALWWEIGHVNPWLKRFVRVEKWRLAAIDSRNAQAAAFAREFKRVMEAG